MEKSGQFRKIQFPAQGVDVRTGSRLLRDSLKLATEPFRGEKLRKFPVLFLPFFLPGINAAELAEQRRNQTFDQTRGQNVSQSQTAPEAQPAVIDDRAAFFPVVDYPIKNPDDGTPCRGVLAAETRRKRTCVAGFHQLNECRVGAGRVDLLFVQGDHETQLFGTGHSCRIDAVFDVVFRAEAVEPRIKGRAGSKPDIADFSDLRKSVHAFSAGRSRVLMKPRSHRRW